MDTNKKNAVRFEYGIWHTVIGDLDSRETVTVCGTRRMSSVLKTVVPRRPLHTLRPRCIRHRRRSASRPESICIFLSLYGKEKYMYPPVFELVGATCHRQVAWKWVRFSVAEQNKCPVPLRGLGIYLVPATGIEPVRILLRGILSPLCLPIPPCRHRFVIVTQKSPSVKKKGSKEGAGSKMLPAIFTTGQYSN